MGKMLVDVIQETEPRYIVHVSQNVYRSSSLYQDKGTTGKRREKKGGRIFVTRRSFSATATWEINGGRA